MNKYKIFIVEDDVIYAEMLKYYLSMNPDFEVISFATAKDCLANLHRKPDLISLDYSLPDAKGKDILKRLKESNPDLPVIVISGQDDISIAVELLKSGATEYLVKNDSTKGLLWNAITRIRETQSLKQEVEQLREELGNKYDLSKLIKGNSQAIQKVFKLIEKAARTSINVSISGETGTGKEVVAKAIHYSTQKTKAPFVAVNMGAIPKELVESELFGHEKGAFTGAVARKMGKFEEANNGTLFLDEIAELEPGLQSKLLRVIQEREVVRVGGNEKVKLDLRIITATHKNLAEEVKKGNFREDLYYRIIGLNIELPPLRERGNDILLLAKFFLDEFCARNKMPSISISQGAKEKLMSYNYPGNIRELKAAMELAAVMCNDNMLTPDDITFSAASVTGQLFSFEKTLREFDLEIVLYFLKKYDNNIQKVAQKLDIGKSTIYRMLKENEITL